MLSPIDSERSYLNNLNGKDLYINDYRNAFRNVWPNPSPFLIKVSGDCLIHFLCTSLILTNFSTGFFIYFLCLSLTKDTPRRSYVETAKYGPVRLVVWEVEPVRALLLDFLVIFFHFYNNASTEKDRQCVFSLFLKKVDLIQ